MKNGICALAAWRRRRAGYGAIEEINGG